MILPFIVSLQGRNPCGKFRLSFEKSTPLFTTYLQNAYLQFRTLYEIEVEICLFGMFCIGVSIL